MLDNVLASFSLLQDVQTEQSARQFSRTMSELDTVANQISLPVLQPPNFRQEFPDESRAFFLYLSNIREATASAQAGHNDYAKQMLRGGVPASFASAVQSVERHWNCAEVIARKETEAVKTIRNTKKSEASDTKFKNQLTEMAGVVSGNSKSEMRGATNASRRGATVNQNVTLAGSALLFVIMAILMAGIGLFFVRRQANQSRAREERRLIHRPAKIRIGTRSYTLIIVDMTRQGLKIKHSGMIQRQRKLRIRLAGRWYKGQIKWNNHFFAGVMLNKPIDDKTFQHVIDTSEEVFPEQGEQDDMRPVQVQTPSMA